MSMQCHKVITLETFAKLLTSDSSVVSTKNFILRTSCLAALGLCQQGKYRAVEKIFLVFYFSQDVATFVFIRLPAWDTFCFWAESYIVAHFVCKMLLDRNISCSPRFISSGEIYSRTVDILSTFSRIYGIHIYAFPDLKFVKNFTQSDFCAKNFTH